MIRQAPIKREPSLRRKDHAKEKAIRVITIDDSALIRLTLNRYLNQYADIDVVGQGGNGSEMLSLVDDLIPDVVILDVEMPVMNGLEALDQLMASRPMPVIMLSGMTQSGTDVTLQALELGAVDFVVKPQQGTTMAETVEILVQKIRNAAHARVQLRPGKPPGNSDRRVDIGIAPDTEHGDTKCISPLKPTDTLLAVASSTGGPSALTAFLSAIPPGLLMGGVIVQHMPKNFTTILSQRLDRISGYKIVEAVDGSKLMRGQLLIAPGGYHLTFDSHGIASLNEGPTVNGVRPAADITFQSLAQAFGPQITAVVLTGMGNDGFAGAQEIHQYGGRILAQDEKSAVVFGMPRRIVESNLADYVAAPEALGAYLAKQVA